MKRSITLQTLLIIFIVAAFSIDSNARSRNYYIDSNYSRFRPNYSYTHTYLRSTPASSSIWGTQMKIGSTSFGNWYSSSCTSIYGTSQRVGNMTFHNYYNSNGDSYSGTTINIGNFHYSSLLGR
jgi:hypothetical protein